jgi:hypothetical protein
MHTLLTCFVIALLVVPFFRLLTYISKRRNRLTAGEVADKIERHIQGTEGPSDWDHFTSIPIADDRLDEIRLRCTELDTPTPISAGKMEELKRVVQRLRNNDG